MSYDPSQYNPYASPNFDTQPSSSARAKRKVTPPAIALLIVGSLGLIFSVLSVVLAAVREPRIDPNAPPFLQEAMKYQTGPLAVAIQSLFVILNIVILIGGAQMIRMKTWGLGMSASILAMINAGNCCCLLGLPVGIWSLVVLLNDDVKSSFS
jgi:hypothetical protein